MSFLTEETQIIKDEDQSSEEDSDFQQPSFVVKKSIKPSAVTSPKLKKGLNKKTVMQKKISPNLQQKGETANEKENEKKKVIPKKKTSPKKTSLSTQKKETKEIEKKTTPSPQKYSWGNEISLSPPDSSLDYQSGFTQTQAQGFYF